MKTKPKEKTHVISSFFKIQLNRITALLLAICMIINLMPIFSFTAVAADNGTFQATQAINGGNYAVLNWAGTTGSKFAVEKSSNTDNIYETIPLKYTINVLNVYPNIGNNLKSWMQTNGTGSPTIDGTKYTMTVNEVPISAFNSNPSSYLGTPGNWKYDVVYFGGYDANNNNDISLTARNLLEQFINSSGGVLLGHDTAAFNYTNFKYLASTYLNLQATEAETSLPSTSPDYIPMYGNTKVKVAKKGLLTNYPYTLGDVGTIMTVPESHSYHEFASSNIWFSYNGTNNNWDPSRSEITTYKGKSGTNNFYLTTLNNVAMIQTGHFSGSATLDEQKILTNTLYYLAQTTNETTFDDHSAQDLTAPSKVSGSVTLTKKSLSFPESLDLGNDYRYKLYTVDDVNGTKTDTGKTAQTTVKTGLKGYSYIINQSETAINVDTTVDATNASIDVSTLTPGNYYLHIRAVDNAGNASDESVLAFTIKPVQPSGSVTLNKPVFTNDKSGYTFKSAIINNFTSVKSITFSTTKGTTIQSVPKFLTPSSKLESINGDTRTFTYVFDNGITVSQGEEFIRGIIFNYVTGSEISITVDNNTTKLPDNAKITKFAHTDGTDHYYMYVPSNFISWTNAYNMAKSYSYMGFKGYLATITSLEEDEILTNISTISAWSAGTRYLNNDNSKLADPTSVTGLSSTANYYYWACGPEAGAIYYNSAASTLTPGPGYTGYNGAYNNWGANPKQPDANISNETCMQVNWPLDKGSNGKMRWNDLPNEGLPMDDLVKGYFVEFSNYAGGIDSNYASDKTAVGTYNLATDGGVEEVSTVTLNEPVYTNGNKSIFSFDNALITNISTIYSLTIKQDNYTSVLSKPLTPKVSNELSNIAGATNTVTYQFENGITLSEAQSFLRGIKFRYGGLKTTSTTNVSVIVDGNKTNLPTGANITEYNGHYYMYVSDNLSWTDAYNKAKTYSYMGYTGYLATITSADEDKILNNISMNGAWSAGTRYTGAYDTNVAPNGALNQYFKWACGPEAGTNYYYFASTSNKYPVSGSYNGFVDINEPNGWSSTDGKTECCLQVHYKGEAGDSTITWNDLRDIVYSGDYNGFGYEPKVGYFVEFSDYKSGRVNSFIQSAHGASTVPITVTKGDIFNTIKEGSTYYVDTLLTAFDRNITKITVNNTDFTSGSKLLGNKDISYEIVATDLEGNTATTSVTMKTIASISEPIKNLTVSNVKISDKESILAVKGALMAIDTTDASDVQKVEISNAIQNCKNLYFALFNATAIAPNGTNHWYKNGIGDITLTAPEGFTISASDTGVWTSSLLVDKADGADKGATYYLKETSTGDISNVKSFTYKVDTVAPTGTINIKSNAFKSFINNITFGLFFKNSVDVSISGNDILSPPVNVSYQIISKGETYNENGAWISGSSFSVPANNKFSIYARLTDTAGNITIINSNGVVVYTDSTQGTTNISFTKQDTTDVIANVNLNGNTVKDIKNSSTVIDPANYSVAANGTITFKARYLESLKVGTYNLTISYNPMGESFSSANDNQAPSTTALTLMVKGKDMSEIGGISPANVIIEPDTMVYNGTTFNPMVKVIDGVTLLTEGIDYTLSCTSDMINASEKNLTVAFMDNYTGSVTKKAFITNAKIIDTTKKEQSVTYNNSMQTIATLPTAETINNQPIAVKYSLDGKNYTMSSAPQFTSAGSYTVNYQVSAPNHDTLTGKIAFTINAATNNTISNLAISGWTFGEKCNTPTATVKYGTIQYTYSNKENGTYSDNIPSEAGTYWVKARVASTDDYNSCEAKKSFIISDKPIESKDISIDGVNEYYLFTGNAIVPEPTVAVNGTILTEGIDYTLAHENNTEISKSAKIKVILKNNYSGSAEKTFEIRYGTIKEEAINTIFSLPNFNSKGWYNKDIVISSMDGWTICKSPTGTFGNEITMSNESTNNGTNSTFYIKAADHSIYERTLNYKLDKTAPEGSITIEKSGLKSFFKTITFGFLFNDDVNITVASNDTLSGISKVEIYKADKELTEEQLAEVKWSPYTSTIHEVAKDTEHFIYYARITDNAGNTVITNSEGVTFDTTAPVINGITNGETYYITQKVSIIDANYDIVTVNGKDFVSGNILSGNTKETYEIIAKDKAGNTTTVTVIMKPISKLSDNMDILKENNVQAEDKEKIEDIKKKAEAIDTTNATIEEKEALQKIIDKCNDLLMKIEAEKNTTEAPKTGDTNSNTLWISLLFVSGLTLTLCVKKKSKKSTVK